MSRALVVAVTCAIWMGWWAPPAYAQAASQPTAAADIGPDESRLWLTAGVGFSTLRGDCQTCEEEYPYRHSASIFGNGGYRVTRQMDVGAEVLWMGLDTPDGQIRTTHIDAVAQFRPWPAHGFFLKGGAGMAFVRNWVDAIGTSPINQKALSVVIGTGWVFRPASRLGLQVFGSQHVAALGDLTTSTEDVPDVIGNFWSIGVAIVIR